MASRTLPFISWDEGNGRFRVDEEAASMLCSLDRKIAVVISAGRYRSGKSFLMGQLSGGASFAVGHTIESHTRGIWLCGEPLQAIGEDGQAVDVLFMDSEGLGANDKNQQHDVAIFSLAVLLCSTLLYNGGGSIDEASIQQLGFIANLAKHIRVRGAKDGHPDADDGSEELPRFFPAFLWVLRDFGLALVDSDGQPMSSDEYMEDSLQDQSGYDKATMARNRIRKVLRGFFRDRHCFTLVRPVEGEEDLQRLGGLSPAEMARVLRPDFTSQVGALKSFILQNAKAKEVAGRTVTGPLLVAMARSYVAAINAGGVPCIADAWESAASGQCARAASAVLNLYSATMKPGATAAEVRGSGLPGSQPLPALPVDESVLHSAHVAATAASMKLYEASAPSGAAALVEKQRVVLRAQLSDAFAVLQASNVDASGRACRAVVRELVSSVMRPMLDGLADKADTVRSQAESLRGQADQVAQMLASQAAARSTEGKTDPGAENGGIINDEPDEIDAEAAEAVEAMVAKASALPQLTTSEAMHAVMHARAAFCTQYSARAAGPHAQSVFIIDAESALCDVTNEATQLVDDAIIMRRAADEVVQALARQVLQLTEARRERAAGAYLRAQSSLAGVTAQLAESSGAGEVLREEIAATREEANSLRQELDHARAESEAARKDAIAAKRSDETTRAALEDSRKALAKAQDTARVEAAQGVSIAARLESRLRSAEDELDRVKRDSSDLSVKRSEGDAESERLRDELERARGSVHAANVERERARVEAEAARGDAARLKVAVDKLREENAGMSVKLASGAEQATSVRRRDSEAAAASVSSLEAETGRLRSELAAVELERDQAAADAERLRSTLARANAANLAETLSLREELEVSQGIISNLEEQLTTFASEMAKLVHEAGVSATGSERERQAASNKVEALCIDRDAARAIADELEEDLEAERKRAEVAVAEVHLLKTELVAARAEADELDNERIAAETAAQQLRAQASAGAANVVATSSTVASLQARIADLEIAQTHLRADIEEKNVKIRDLEASVLSERQASLDAKSAAMSAREELLGSKARAAKAVEIASSAASDEAVSERDRLAHEVSALNVALARKAGESDAYSRELASVKEQLLRATTESRERDAAARELSVALGTAKQTSRDNADTLEAAKEDLMSKIRQIEILGLELEKERNKVSEVNGAMTKMSTEKAALEAMLGDAQAKASSGGGAAAKLFGGSRQAATLDGLRAANREYEKAVDRLSSELHELNVAKNKTSSELADAVRRVTSLEEALAAASKAGAEAASSRDTAQAACTLAQARGDDLSSKLQVATSAAVDAAASADSEITQLKGALAASEADAQSARSVRGALEKQLRSATLDLATAKGDIAHLEGNLAVGVGERDKVLTSVDSARHELAVIGANAADALRQKEAQVRALHRTAKDLEGQLRRRGEVDTAVAAVRAGAETTKYKAVGRAGLKVEQRYLAVTTLAVMQPIITAGATALKKATDGGDVLAWAVAGRKAWSKGVRMADVRAIVMGTSSPVFQRYENPSNSGIGALDSTRCFTVIVKGGAVLLGESAGRKPVPGDGCTFDFEVPTSSECTTWVYALRCLQLRSAGFGLYSLSRLTVKLERIGLRVRAMAAREDTLPRVFLANLRDEAKEEAGLMSRALSTLYKAHAGVGVGRGGASKSSGMSSMVSAVRRNSKFPTRVGDSGADSDDDGPAMATTRPVAASAASASAGLRSGAGAVVKVPAPLSDDDDGPALPSAAKMAVKPAVLAPIPPAPAAVPITIGAAPTPTAAALKSSGPSSTAAAATASKPPIATPAGKSASASLSSTSVASGVKNTANRSALFSGAHTDKPYTSPGTYSAERKASATPAVPVLVTAKASTPAPPVASASLLKTAIGVAGDSDDDDDGPAMPGSSRPAQPTAKVIIAVPAPAAPVPVALKAVTRGRGSMPVDKDEDGPALPPARVTIKSAAVETKPVAARVDARVHAPAPVPVPARVLAVSAKAAVAPVPGSVLPARKPSAPPPDSDDDDDDDAFAGSAFGKQKTGKESEEETYGEPVIVKAPSSPAKVQAGPTSKPPVDSDSDSDSDRAGPFARKPVTVSAPVPPAGLAALRRDEPGARKRSAAPRSRRNDDDDDADEDLDLDGMVSHVEASAHALGKSIPGDMSHSTSTEIMKGKTASSTTGGGGGVFGWGKAKKGDDEDSAGGPNRPVLDSRKVKAKEEKRRAREEAEAQKREAEEAKRREVEKKAEAIAATTKAMAGDLVVARRKDSDDEADSDDDAPRRRGGRGGGLSSELDARSALFARSGAKAEAAPATPRTAPATSAALASTPSARSTGRPSSMAVTSIQSAPDLPTPPPVVGAGKEAFAVSKGGKDGGSRGGGGDDRSMLFARSSAVPAPAPGKAGRPAADSDEEVEEAGYRAPGTTGRQASRAPAPAPAPARGKPPPDSDDDEDEGRFGIYG